MNLALVIDRSGSMSGAKIQLTREAAAWVVRALSATDFLSIVPFSHKASVLVFGRQLHDKEGVLQQINTITAEGSTALFDGWKAGADQIFTNLDSRRLNRVIVLTDGQANVGLTDPDRICDEVHAWAERGVCTTTMGFGRDYNEVLLRSMAASGEGNHFFVETPEQLATFFQLELDGLEATVGTAVRLRLKALHPEVQIEPLGEVQVDGEGVYHLADLIADYPLQLLFRLRLPVTEPCLVAELSWHCPRTGTVHRQEIPLRVPRVPQAERLAMPVNPEVEAQLAVAMAARARREAMSALNRGDRAEATQILARSLVTRDLPELERQQIEQLKKTVDAGDANVSNKIASAQSFSYGRGSVALSTVDDQFVRTMVESGAIPVRYGRLFEKGPDGRDRPFRKVRGMLGDLAAADRSGEASQLVFATLPLMNGNTRILSTLSNFLKALARAPVTHPSPSLVRFRAQAGEPGASFTNSGVEASDCGAVRRVAPLLLSRWKSGDNKTWSWVTMGSFVTHNDGASMAASLGFAHLLWDLLAMTAAPAPDFYLQHFLETIADLETDGSLSGYLQRVIPDARRRGLSLVEAQMEWGSGDSLLEAIPGVLYGLECRGHRPPAEPPREALLGAALGALHGPLYACPAEFSSALDEAESRCNHRI